MVKAENNDCEGGLTFYGGHKMGFIPLFIGLMFIGGVLLGIGFELGNLNENIKDLIDATKKKGKK